MLTRKFSVRNLAANWYVPLSALVLFVMQENFTRTGYAEAVVAFLALCVLCGCVARGELWSVSVSSGIGLKVYSWLTALGVCSFSHTYMYERMMKHPDRLAKLLGIMHLPEGAVYYVVLAVSLLGMVFVYLWTSYLLHKFMKLTKSSGLFRDISRAEKLAYTIIFAASVIFVTVVFARTSVFFSPGTNYDIIYTSDTGRIISQNCFLNISHVLNDIRQPLFAVFATPFMGVPYILGRIAGIIAGHDELMTSLFMNYVQIAMLLAGVFLLAKSMKLSPIHRVLFSVIFACSYVYLLAILNMEQYIVAFFWLMVCVYLVCNVSEPDSLALYGATGTLTTGVVFTPFYLFGGGGYGGSCVLHWDLLHSYSYSAGQE